MGSSHVLALTADGSVFGWGEGAGLGLGDLALLPVRLASDLLSEAAAVAAAPHASAVLGQDGRVWLASSSEYVPSNHSNHLCNARDWRRLMGEAEGSGWVAAELGLVRPAGVCLARGLVAVRTAEGSIYVGNRAGLRPLAHAESVEKVAAAGTTLLLATQSGSLYSWWACPLHGKEARRWGWLDLRKAQSDSLCEVELPSEPAGNKRTKIHAMTAGMDGFAVLGAHI